MYTTRIPSAQYARKPGPLRNGSWNSARLEHHRQVHHLPHDVLLPVRRREPRPDDRVAHGLGKQRLRTRHGPDGLRHYTPGFVIGDGVGSVLGNDRNHPRRIVVPVLLLRGRSRVEVHRLDRASDNAPQGRHVAV